MGVILASTWVGRSGGASDRQIGQTVLPATLHHHTFNPDIKPFRHSEALKWAFGCRPEHEVLSRGFRVQDLWGLEALGVLKVFCDA